MDGVDWGALRELPYLYLTTTGRVSGEPRQIEIWFVLDEGRFYLFAENRQRAQWVRNIGVDPNVRARVGEYEFVGRARVLDEAADAALWERVQAAAVAKYGWGDGLPVEITVMGRA